MHEEHDITGNTKHNKILNTETPACSTPYINAIMNTQIKERINPKRKKTAATITAAAAAASTAPAGAAATSTTTTTTATKKRAASTTFKGDCNPEL